jgi:hypothetical protein
MSQYQVEVRSLDGKLLVNDDSMPYLPRMNEHIVLGDDFYLVEQVAYDMSNKNKVVLFVSNHSEQQRLDEARAQSAYEWARITS